MRAQCRPSTALWRLLLHFLTLPVPILALCSRVMGQRYGCIPVRVRDRETGRESEFIGAPGGTLMLSEFNPSGKTVILPSALFVLFPFWYWPLCHWAVVGYDPFKRLLHLLQIKI